MAISGYEKAALFLSTVGEDVAARILQKLEPEVISKITVHMTKDRENEREELEWIYSEVKEKITSGAIHLGGEDYVKKMLSKGLGHEDAKKVLEMASKNNPFESLKKIEPKTIANFLMSEHPQTIAIILCLLEPEQAAEVMLFLPEHMRADVAMRVASTEKIQEGALDEIKEVIKTQLDVTRSSQGKVFNGPKVIAEILNQCDRNTEQGILEKIDEKDSNIAETIRELMLIFEDLALIDDRGIQMVLKEVDTAELSIALKSAPDVLKEKIFKNMSQRAVKILKEEMETKGPVRVSEVEKAQKSIVDIARRLDQEGQIIIAGKGGEEMVE